MLCLLQRFPLVLNQFVLSFPRKRESSNHRKCCGVLDSRLRGNDARCLLESNRFYLTGIRSSATNSKFESYCLVLRSPPTGPAFGRPDDKLRGRLEGRPQASRAVFHPSRRRFAPPQDEVRKRAFYSVDLIGFMEW